MSPIRPISPIKRKRVLLAFSLTLLVALLPLVYFILRSPKSTQAGWWHGDWQYRKVIPISSHTSAETNVYIAITAYDASDTTKYQTDCGDVRFTKYNGELLPYTVTSCGASTTFNVLFDSFPAGAQDIYIYYGNPNAPNGFQSAAFSTQASNYALGTLGTEATTPGPIGYWKFDEGQGQTTYDTTQKKSNGTLGATSGSSTDDPTWVEESRCVSGKCLQFDGGDYVNVSGTIAGVQSVGFWVKPTTTTASMLALTTSARITASSGTISATGFTSPTIYVNGAVSSTLTANSWQYIEVTTGTAITANAITIGTANSAFTTGFIDDVKIYPYARTASEIRQDFVRGAAVLGEQDQKDFLSDGLVGYWKMEETTTPSLDSSGNSNSGTWNGTAAAAAGKFGNGISLDGDSDFIALSASLAPSNITITGWIKPGASSVTGAVAENPSKWGLRLRSGKLNFVAATANNAFSFSTNNSTTTLSSGTWYHVAVTYDGTNTRYYLNGSGDGTDTLHSGNLLDSSTINLGKDTNSLYTNGVLDEVRVYNRALSPTEVRQLYSWAPGPVGYWNMDEGTGTAANDTSGNGLTGTLTSGPTWTNGKYGKGISFDGSTNYVNVGSSSATDTTSNQVTLSAWVKRSNTGTGRVDVISKGTTRVYALQVLSNKVNPLLYFTDASNSDQAALSTSTFDTASWHYISATYDGSVLRTYFDGVQQASSTINKTLVNNTSAITIGRLAAASDEFFGGNIDDVRIYNYARTSQQIVEDMTGGHPSGASAQGGERQPAAGYWKFDEGQGTTANDNSINRNNLTLSTASWQNSGKINKAWNGTGALWLSRADDADFDFTNTEDFAMSLWYKSDSADNPSAAEYLVNKASATIAGYAIYANTSGNLCFGIDDDTTWGPDIPSCTTTDVYDNSWHHLLALRDTTSDKTYIYIDGVLKDSDSDTTSATLANSLLLYVGDRDGTDNGDEFTGDIDELKIYRASLSLDQILVDYNAGAAAKYSVGVDEASDLSDGAGNAPVGYWNMDEGSPNTCTSGVNDSCDTSGNGNDAAWSGNATKTIGKYGNSLKLDGNGDYASFTRSTDIQNITNAGTIEAWVKYDLLDSQLETAFDLAGTGSNGLILFSNNASNVPRLQYGNGTTTQAVNATGITLQTGQWYHLAGTWDSTSGSLYVNGVLNNSSGTDPSVSVGSGTSYIGAQSGTQRYHPGPIDDVKIYNYARTAAQVAYDYNRGAPVGHWKLDECQGATAYDSSPNRNNGTITIGASGEDTVGTCTTSSTAWGSGATGKYSASLDLDGTDDYVSVTDTANLRFDASTADFSLFAWVKRSTTGTEYILSKEDADNDGWRLMFNSSNQVVCSEDATDVTSTSTITDTNWHLVGCTIDRDGNGQMYIDGKADGATAAMGTDAMATTANITFGTRAYTATSYLNGQIDDVKIFNYALSANQVKILFNEGGAVRYGQ